MILCVRKLTEDLYDIIILTSLNDYVETNGRLNFKTYPTPLSPIILILICMYHM